MRKPVNRTIPDPSNSLFHTLVKGGRSAHEQFNSWVRPSSRVACENILVMKIRISLWSLVLEHYSGLGGGGGSEGRGGGGWADLGF